LWRQFPDGDAIASAATPIAYDAAGRLKSVPGLITNTVYDARGQATSVTRANTVNSTLTYSPQRGWLTALNTAKGATVIQDYGYTRDALGRITAVTSTQAGESWTYGYDDLDRLLSADNTTDNTLDQAWSYDSVDNMLTNSRVGSYSYPAPGSARPHAVTGVSGGPLGSQSFAYDANGNMTGQGGDVRVYDGENRLVSSTDGATTVQYVYGPDGARLKKIVGSTTTLYLGADLEKTGTTWTKYLPGDAKRVGSSTGPLYWMHRDHLQSVRAETNSAGTIVNSAKYRPFGERLTVIATVAEAKGFIGERHDPETGLMYLNARYYDPVLGRFMSADPMSPTLPGVGVNRYAYAFNNPIMMLDPSGLGGNAAGNYAAEHGIGNGGKEASFNDGPGSYNDGVAAQQAYNKMRTLEKLTCRACIKNGRLDENAVTAAVSMRIMFSTLSRDLPSVIRAQSTAGVLGPPPIDLDKLRRLGRRGVAGLLGALVGIAIEEAMRAKYELALRVEGISAYGVSNIRIQIGEDGTVMVVGDDSRLLHINFNQLDRALKFATKRVSQGWTDVRIKAFAVEESFVDELRATAVPQSQASEFPDAPQIDDPTKAPDQYGLRGPQIQGLRDAIVQGTGVDMSYDDFRNTLHDMMGGI
jgi:RHS repeat-associated protein